MALCGMGAAGSAARAAASVFGEDFEASAMACGTGAAAYALRALRFAGWMA
ncbi:MAG TPA: hypothetical protein VKT99_01940 [Xanthobacteraceae bacterium]|jgi:hypothetical protein|nr:hypothetical protein [Xanthobacteraceae bacterium]